MDEKYENPWDIKSIYDLLVFKCPLCLFDSPSKQSFVNHACGNHPESIPCLLSIGDGSLEDVIIPSSIKLEEPSVGTFDDHFMVDDDYEDVKNFCETEIKEDKPKKLKVKKVKPKKSDASPAVIVGIQCQNCDQQFKNYYRLSKHVLTSHDINTDEVIPDVKSEMSDEPIRCDKCLQLFNNNQELSDHLRIDHSSKCVLCLNSYDSVSKHLVEDHQRVEFGCTGCQLFCDSEKEMLDHFKVCGNSLKCPVCLTQISCHKHLRRHIKTTHWGFARPERVSTKSEGGETSEETSWTCHICGVARKNKQSLDSHIKKVHEKKAQKHQCDQCEKEYASKKDLAHHKTHVHEGLKNFQCDLCGNDFARKDYLKKHIQNTHEGQRNYQCSHCGQCCTRKSGLNKHIERFHKEFRKFPCDRCPKSFATKGELANHILNIHEGVKNYRCPLCNKEFFRKDNFETHIKIVHRGEKDFMCGICGKEFTRNKQLEQHAEVCHPKIPPKPV